MDYISQHLLHNSLEVVEYFVSVHNKLFDTCFYQCGITYFDCVMRNCLHILSIVIQERVEIIKNMAMFFKCSVCELKTYSMSWNFELHAIHCVTIIISSLVTQ